MTAMQSPVHSERFDSDWNRMIGSFWAMGLGVVPPLRFVMFYFAYGIFISLFLLAIYTLSRRKKTPAIKFLIVMSCVMAVLGTTQMAVTIAAAIVEGRLVQQVVHGQVLNQRDPKLTFQMLAMAQNVLYAMNKKIVIMPVLLMLSTFTGRIMWIQRAASHVGLDRTLGSRYNTAIGVILESGAIYCIAGLILVIYLSLGDLQLCTIVFGVGQQLLNIIPTFTLVYVGLANPADDRPVVTHQIPSKHAAFRSAAVQQPIQPGQVTETCRLPVIENIGKTLNITFKQHSTVPIAFRWSYLMKFI
ncbi:hypothetical protein B0H13DRAFT_1903522 [Mycena leptocephala]|nr:hypothetical protein B0H13DRAFT_1903522 [Mycena leptocephala]